MFPDDTDLCLQKQALETGFFSLLDDPMPQ